MRNECLDAVTEELDRVGVPYTIDTHPKHVHVRYGEDRQHVRVIAKTASDWRAEKNERAAIRRDLKQYGYVKADDEPEAELRPAIIIKEGDLRCTSIDVAQKFGREHRDVLRAIDNVRQSCGREFDLRNFTTGQYIDPKGRSYRQIEMTRDGFSLIVMGFTGEAAMKWKVAYINAFSEMEATLRSLSPADEVKAMRSELDAVLELMASIEGPKPQPHRYVPPRMARRQQERRSGRSAA